MKLTVFARSRPLAEALVLVPVLALAQVDTAWTRRVNGPASGSDWAYCLAPDGAGGVYVSGNNEISSSNSDWATIHYLANGDTAWLRRWTSPGNHNERSNMIKTGPSGDLYLVGYTMLAGNGDYMTIKHASNGDTIWSRRYASTGTGYDFGSTIVLDDSENVIVSGYSQNRDLGSVYQYATVKYSRDGVERWVARACTSGALSYPALAVDDSCNIILAGYTQLPGQGDDDLVVIKYRSDGTVAWRRHYNGPGDSTDRANAVMTDPDGNIYVAGYTLNPAGNGDFAVIKYNRQGDSLWTRLYNGPDNLGDLGLAVFVYSSSEIYVAGNSTGSGTASDFLLIKYTADGDTVWTARYDGPGSSADNIEAGLRLDRSGNIYIAGTSNNGANSDFCVVKYNPDGQQQWVGRYNGPANAGDLCRGIGVDSLGNVFICGTSSNGADYDMATVKFTQPSGASEQPPVRTVPALSLNVTPNLCTRAAVVSYSLPVAGPVRLRLYDMTGKLVRVLASGPRSAGNFAQPIPTGSLARGVYVLELTACGARAERKLTVQ